MCLNFLKFNQSFIVSSERFNLSSSYTSEIACKTLKDFEPVFKEKLNVWAGINEMGKRGIRYRDYPLVLGSLEWVPFWWFFNHHLPFLLKIKCFQKFNALKKLYLKYFFLFLLKFN